MRIEFNNNQRQEIKDVSGKAIRFKEFIAPDGDVSEYIIILEVEADSLKVQHVPLYPSIDPYWRTRAIFPLTHWAFNVPEDMSVFIHVKPGRGHEAFKINSFINFAVEDRNPSYPSIEDISNE